MKPIKKCSWTSGVCAAMFKKEAREHPSLGKPVIKQIVLDHMKGKKK
jgi:hypothetical protein